MDNQNKLTTALVLPNWISGVCELAVSGVRNLMKNNPSLRSSVLLTVVTFALVVQPARAQVPISTLSGGPYTQDFDSLANGPVGAQPVWADNVTLPGWYAARQLGGAFTNYTVDVGALGLGGLYAYGVGGVNPVTDRALGVLSSGAVRTLAFGLRFTNDTATTLTNLTVSYTGEQWRQAGFSSGITSNLLTFWYRITNSPITSPDPTTNATWTPAPAFFFNAPIGASSSNGAALDGNSATNRQVFSSIVLTNVAVSPGQEVFLRWLTEDSTLSGDAGLAVDDLTVSYEMMSVATPPAIISIHNIANDGTASSTIGVRFDQPVTLPSATGLTNYVVNSGTVTVSAVHLRPDGRSVELVTSGPVGEFFSVCAAGVQGVAGTAALTIGTGYTSEYSGITIGTPGDPAAGGQAFTAFWDTFDVTVGGSGIGKFDDHFHFVQQLMTGDFDVRVSVAQLDFADGSAQAGLMARESLNATSASVQIYLMPTGGVNQIEATVRPLPSADTSNFLTIAPLAADANTWLRLTRTNDVFTAYYGTNGMDWSVSGVTTQSFATNLYVGMATSARSFGTNTTASFTDFYAEGRRPGDEIHPTLTASLSGNNLQFTWPQTPRAYALEISTSLVGSNQWGLLVIPTYFNTTNRVFQTGFPASLLGSQLFARNVRVDKLLPNIPAIMVTGGIILSPGAGLKSTTSGTLCGIQVTNAYTYTNTFVYMTNTTSNSWIDTLSSSSGMDTVLSVANTTLNPFATGVCQDNSASPVDLRSKLIPLPSPYVTLTKFGIVAAPKKTSAPATVVKIQLNP